MRIRSFHMDGFGLFADVTVDPLPSGLSVFLGNNEAGKSTCLQFFRVMLTGYGNAKSRERRSFAPLRGGQPGGGLTLETRRYGAIRLTRRPDGPPTLLDAQGNSLDAAVLDSLMAGVNREVYRNVFGFSLTELQHFGSLNSEGVRNALYGASFGQGLRGPAEVFKNLDARMDALFKAGGSKPSINAALRTWEELRRGIREAEEECAAFDALTLELREADAALKALGTQRGDLETQRRELERRLAVWGLRDEWQTLGTRLGRLDAVPDGFPQDGPARLDRLTRQREDADRRRRLLLERLDQENEALEALVIEEKLLAALPEIRLLAERKSGFRNALSQRPVQAGALQRARDVLAEQLRGLGPDWTCARIRGTDRSLFVRESLERRAGEMNVAAASRDAAAAALDKAGRDVESAEHNQRVAQSALDYLPAPVATLDEEGRESLRRILARIEDDRRHLPERRAALEEARNAFGRMAAPLRLRPGRTDQALASLAEAQDRAQQLSDAVRLCLAEAQETARNLTQAQEAESLARGRLERCKAQRLAAQGPAREALDQRAAALRALRHAAAELSVEEDRLAEVTGRLADLEAPKPRKSVPLMCFGLFLALVGLAMAGAVGVLGLSSLTLGPDLTLPLTDWSGYATALAGLVLLYLGRPHAGPEARRHAAEVAQLGSRLDACQDRVAQCRRRMDELCAQAQVDSADPITLDATEMLLERDRERCVAEERLAQDLHVLEDELTAARQGTRERDAERQQADTEVQRARKLWHEYLSGCQVEAIPAAEAVGTFFARVESARMARAAVRALEKDVAALENRLAEQEAAARAVPPVAELLDSEAPLPAVLDAARHVLDTCREADLAAAERLRAQADVNSAALAQERAAMAQGEAADALHAAEDALGAAREAWGDSLEALGLDRELSPGTARDALECMERCLTAAAEQARLEDEIRRADRELDALARPLGQLLEHLARSPRDDADGQPDWLATLDALLQDAASMEDMARRRAAQQQRRDERQEEVRAAELALADARRAEQELLGQADVADAEEFLRLAAVAAERVALARRREDVEDALRLAAAKTPFREFLDSFDGFDRDERQALAADLSRQLEALSEEEKECAARRAELAARLTRLAAADTLASLRQQEASLLESLRRDALNWSRAALARQVLATAKNVFEQERQPQVIRRASEILATITDKAWTGLAASLDDNSLTVQSPQGQAVLPEALSRGAQEQVYLSLRLAYIQNHAEHAAALPVIMDDILVNFDPQRARHTAAALRQLTSGPEAHQILFFTCHPHIADMLQTELPSSALFLVKDGGIHAA